MIERWCADCRLIVRDRACAKCGRVVYDKPSKLEYLDGNVKPSKSGITVDVHRRIEALRARALEREMRDREREARERAAIVARIVRR
jgi:hypothetical protein